MFNPTGHELEVEDGAGKDPVRLVAGGQQDQRYGRADVLYLDAAGEDDEEEVGDVAALLALPPVVQVQEEAEDVAEETEEEDGKDEGGGGDGEVCLHAGGTRVQGALRMDSPGLTRREVDGESSNMVGKCIFGWLGTISLSQIHV